MSRVAMNALSQTVRRQPLQALSRRTALLQAHPHSRSATYRRLLSTRTDTQLALTTPLFTSRFSVPQLRSSFSLAQIPYSTPSSLARWFHAATSSRQDAKPAVDTKPKAAEAAQEPPPKDSVTGDGSKTSQDQTQPTEDDAKQKEDDGKEDEEGGNRQKDGEQGHKKKEEPPPPPHGEKTPWQVFMETMNSEFEKSKEWHDTTKAIASSAHQFTESESVRRAREAYEKTSGAASTAVKTTAGAIGKGAQWTWDTSVVKGVRKAANVTGEAVEKATRPIRETEAYKNVRDVIDDGSSSRYGGWVEKEERRKRREAELEAQGVKMPEEEPLEENPNAGTSVTLHKDAKWKEAWRDFRDNSKVVQGFFNMGQAYQESENPLVSTARLVTDKIGNFFAENETALVIKKIRTMDPAFQMEPFLRDLREYILPEVLDAYVKGDMETLKLWLSAAQYSVYEALTKQYLQAGLRSDGRILDIRHVDIVRARMLDPGDVPVFIITCRTQEVHVYRNAKSGELAAGMEDKVQLVTYAIGVTRVPEDVNNPETRGWRLIEMQKSARDWH